MFINKKVRLNVCQHQNGTCVSLYTVVEENGQPGGHEWFSEDIDGVSLSRILWDFFNEGCNGAMGVELINEETINKKLEKVVDALGREVNQPTNQILFYIYDDGSRDNIVFIPKDLKTFVPS